MIAAVLTLSLIAAAPDASAVELDARGGAPFSLGIDAADILPFRTPRPPPELLAYAPTSQTVSLVASAATTGTGLALSTGMLMVSIFSVTFPPLVALTGIGLGFFLMNFGPNVGDLINGDVIRFLRNGLLRLGALFVLAPLGVFSPLVWLGWMAADIADSRNAPARWLMRHGYLEDSASKRGQSSILPETGTGNVVRVQF